MTTDWLKSQDFEHRGTTVVLRESETAESLFKRFKKKVQKHGIEKEIYQRSFYEKPSVRKRRKHIENLRRIKKEQAKLEKYLRKKRGRKDEDESDK